MRSRSAFETLTWITAAKVVDDAQRIAPEQETPGIIGGFGVECHTSSVLYEQMFDTLTATRTDIEKVAREFEPRLLAGEDAVRLVRELGAIRCLVDGILGKAAHRVEDTSAHRRNGENDRDAAHLVGRALGTDSSEARRAIRTAKKVEKLPDTDAAVRAGLLSARQAELIADAATANPAAEQKLLAAAEEGMVALKEACINAHAEAEDPTKRSERQRRARGVRTWTANDGMFEGHFRLAPEIGGQVKAVLDAEVQRIFRAHRTSGEREPHEAYAADALARLLLEGNRDTIDPAANRAATTVHVVIDHTALVRGNTIPGETCEITGVGPVNVEWVREMLGDAFVTAVIKKGRDITTVAHFGRHIPVHLRTAMIVGGRECVVGCNARGYLEIDHSDVDFAKGGPAAWWNVGYGCSPHHRLKTQGWKLGPRNPKTGKRTLTAPSASTTVSRR